MTNPRSIFEDIQKKLKENNGSLSGATNSFKNENVFKPTKAGTMTVRLLWLPEAAGVKRDFPMINTYVHRFYNANAVKKYDKVICPTSQHMDGENPNGFRNCCICNAVSKFYKESNDSPSARELYQTFHRACECYVPVYVVSGPEELQGQVKILQYGKQFKDFFNRKIFGIVAKTGDDVEPIDTDEIIGIEAFTYYDPENDEVVTTGYDLIISTTIENMTIGNRKVQMPKYTLDFSRKPKSINEMCGVNLKKASGVEYFKGLNEELGFDKNFLVTSTPEERQAFLNSYIIKDESSAVPGKDINSLINNSVDEDEEEEEVKPVKKPVKKAPPVEDDYVEPEDSSSGDADDIDVDKLLADLN